MANEDSERDRDKKIHPNLADVKSICINFPTKEFMYLYIKDMHNYLISTSEINISCRYNFT